MTGQLLDFNSAKRQGELARGIVDADDIRDRLHADARSFVEWMFSGRAFIGQNHIARIGDTQGNPGESLSIHLTGPNAGLWKDHATDEGGDLIELYRAYRGYRDRSNFTLSLKEIAKEYFGDPVEVERATWSPSVSQFIADKKAKLGDKPRADTLELGAPVATYTYYDTRGNVLAAVKRFEPDGTRASKTFRPYCFRTIEGVTKWMAGAPDLRPLYRLPEIAIASTVVLCEGEGCADALAQLGITATSAMQGAHAPLDKTDWSPLASKTVIIWPDNDGPGFQYAKNVSERLAALGCQILGITPPSDVPSKWDASDCVAEGRDAHAIIEGAAAMGEPQSDKPLILSSAEFVAGFRPPEYLIDGVIQQSYLYSLTARTGHGKTAVTMFMGQAIARGKNFHGRQTKPGSVLFLAGENPDDVRARYLVLAHHHGFDPSSVPFHFIDGVIDIAACLPRIRAGAEKIPNLSLVIVDTAAAYFRGDDGNNNVQQGEFARVLRQLTFLPGKPACVVACHPVKNASKENLLPVGGGAFVNEVDGNLTLWGNAEKQTTLHWQGKFRGPEFEPIAFEMHTVECDSVVDANGVLMPSVVAEPVSDTTLERGELKQEDDENLVLKIVAASPRASIAQIATAAKFTFSDGKPAKSKVQRIIIRLLEDKLIERHRGSKYRPTQKGKKEIGMGDDED